MIKTRKDLKDYLAADNGWYIPKNRKWRFWDAFTAAPYYTLKKYLKYLRIYEYHFNNYNAEKWLRECLDSVSSQSLREIEIICVNDGSPDHSLAILKEYAAKDSRIVIIDKQNEGVGAARNDGIRSARGEFIAIYICFWQRRTSGRLRRGSDISLLHVRQCDVVLFLGVFDRHG